MKLVHTLLAAVVSLPSLAQIDRTKLPEPAEARPIEIGNYETFTLKNGLKVFVIENHKLPRVTFRLQLDVDPILEKDKAGYVGMVGDLMKRGTKSRSKENIDEEVDFIGASLSVSSQSAFATGLSKYKEKVLELLSDVILNPVFPEEELEKIKKQAISAIESGKDDPGSISTNLVSKIVYGKGHPYGEISTEETVNNITVEDIRAYHQTYYKPNIAYLAVVGDINLKEAKKLIQKYLAGWESGNVPSTSYPVPERPTSSKVALVNRSNSVQSVLKITYPVVLTPGHEDVIPVRVMMEILGGSFSSRLNMNLREDKGYTYGAGASLSSNELVSRFNAGASVRNEVTDSSIVQILYEMEKLITENVTDEELELAKNVISGGFARSLESPQTVASFAIRTALYDLSEDYYSNYLKSVQSVTKQEVLEMAQKYIHPDKCYITVVGKASEIQDKLKQFGELGYYDTFGGPVDPAMVAIPDGLTVEGVLNKYFDAIGGKAKLQGVTSLKVIMKANAMGQELLFTKRTKAPNKLNIEVSIGGNVMSQQIYDGENAKITQMGTRITPDESMLAQLEIEANPFPELTYATMGDKVRLSGADQVGGKDVFVLEVINSDEKPFSLFFDRESGLLVRKSQTVKAPNGQEMVLSTDFSDYEPVQGILFPKTMKIPLGPGVQADAKVESVELNGEMPSELFSAK